MLREEILCLLKPEYHMLSIEEIPNASISIIKGLSPFHSMKLRGHKINTISDFWKKDLTSLRKQSVLEEDLIQKWSTLTKIIQYYYNVEVNKANVPRNVILIAGLEETGKTSIIASLKEGRTISNNEPTKILCETQLNFFGHNFTVFDLSGKEEFRSLYISEPEKYLNGAIALIYVIDSTRQGKVSESITYLKHLLEILKAQGSVPLVGIFINKFDKTYSVDKTDQKSVERHAQMRVRALMEEVDIIDYFIVRTSIFDPYSLIDAFGFFIRGIGDVPLQLDTELKYFSELYGFMALYLFDQSGMILGEYSARLADVHKKTVSNEVYVEITKFDKIMLNDPILTSKRKQPQITLLKPTSSIQVAMSLVVVNKIPLYLVIVDTDLTNKPKTIGEELNERLTPWFMNFFLPIKEISP